MAMNVSFCICTYNRCENLRLTLDSLLSCANELNDGDEILVIDNNSNDETKEVIIAFSKGLPITYVFESQQGLSAARNKALSIFKHQAIVFVDDDVTISKGFIETYKQAFLKYPDRHFFGGRIEVDWGRKKPYWYKSTDLPMINGLIVYYNLGAQDKPLSNDSLLPYGANFALKRNAVEKIGAFNIKLGVQGKQLGRGEETDYFRRALNNGFRGIYLADAMVHHRFETERVTLAYLYRYGVQKGVATVLLDGAKPHNTATKIAYQALAGIYQLLKCRVDRFFQCVINIGVIRGVRIASLFVEKQIKKNGTG